MNTTSILPLPAHAGWEEFEQDVLELVDANRLGEAEWTKFIQQHYPVFPGLGEYWMPAASVTPINGQFIIARSFGFETWQLLSTFIKEMEAKNSPTAQFESAVDAIISGNLPVLESLLHQNPSLIHTSSLRIHHARLLHYVSANGIEDYRQKTPPNIVAVAEILIKAGAEVDATLSDGQSTTLGLVATSIHPLNAGVQIALLDLLLKAGAAVEGIPGGWRPLEAAIANGCPEAARFLALKGTALYDSITAQSQNPDWINSFLKEDSRLKPGFTKAQLEAALMWACEYGQHNAIEFLLKNGVDMHSLENTGLTGLHWAAAGGRVDTMLMLLKHGASPEIKNYYEGAVLNQALWWPFHGKPVKNWLQVIETLLAAGAKIEPGTLAYVAKEPGISIQEKIALKDLLANFGADS